MFGGDVGGLERGGDEAVRGGNIDDAAPLARAHAGQRGLGGVEGSGQVQRDNLIPFFGGKRFQRRDELHAGVVDEDVDGPELFRGAREEFGDLRGNGEVCAVIEDFDAVG